MTCRNIALCAKLAIVQAALLRYFQGNNKSVVLIRVSMLQSAIA